MFVFYTGSLINYVMMWHIQCTGVGLQRKGENMSQYNKLKISWACRRGMLELDFMIMPFYQQCFDTLSKQQKQVFIELLDYPDPQLFRWLMNQEDAPSKELAAMVHLIQDHLARS